MAVLSVPVVSAFVDAGRGGNPAGVVLAAERFDQRTKQAIAAQIGLSETAFVSPSQLADYKVEFFTPTRQIAHCGHATIATFSYLVQQGLLTATRSSKETIDGTRAILIDGDMAFMEQSAPQYTPLDPKTITTVLQSLALAPSDLLAGKEPTIVHTGNAFLLVPLRSAASVAGVVPDLPVIEAVSDRFDLIGYYLFSPEVETPGRDAGTRMFAPRYGIMEEAATGMAAGPLACFLFDYLDLHKFVFVIEQGQLMQPPSPSVLTAHLTLSAGTITSLMVGGRGAVLRTVEVSVP